ELAGGTVTFNSFELHKQASGVIQENGNYVLGSLTANDGAIPGKYEVSVSPPETAGSGERHGKGRPSAKGILFDQPKDKDVVVKMQSNDIPIQLRRKK